jgi:hypothetical protein
MTLFDQAREAAEALRKAGREEIRKAHAAGVPAYYDNGDGIVREMPDGTRQRIVPGADGRETVTATLPPRRT